jgi:signal transduction histidine kinase
VASEASCYDAGEPAAVMIDLRAVAPSAFVWALESNLRQIRPLYKVCQHFIGAVARHLDADAVWLHRRARGRRAEEKYLVGDERLRDDALVDAFARHQEPKIPRNVALAPLRVHDRRVGLVGAARRGRELVRGEARTLARLTTMLEAELARREEEHLDRVLDRIKEKVVSELRPKDLAYQILDGLFELLHYDHSAALLTHEEGPGTFRVAAEKIAWTKAKSSWIGYEIPVSPDLRKQFRKHRDPVILTAGDATLHPLLDYHKGTGVPPSEAMLVAPLFFDKELLGLLKIADTEHGAFVGKDREVVERFLPAAAVSLRNAQVRESLERQAVAAEMRASLVTLARAVAHDVNNAIGAILPLAEQAREDIAAGTATPDALSQDLAVIIDKAQLCRRIFSNMLRAGAERPGGGRVDANALVREMMPLLDAQAAPRSITLRTELTEGLPPVRFSRLHLERVVWNLVTNALEAFPGRGGEIAISTVPVDGVGVAMIVRDNGPGFAPEHLARAAEPFFSTKPNGTGLGLSICRALAWQYRASLDIRSAPGQGTEVLVTLAAATDES